MCIFHNVVTLVFCIWIKTMGPGGKRCLDNHTEKAWKNAPSETAFYHSKKHKQQQILLTFSKMY